MITLIFNSGYIILSKSYLDKRNIRELNNIIGT